MNSSTTRYSPLTYLMKLGVEAKHPYSTSACYIAQLEAWSFSQVEGLDDSQTLLLLFHRA